MTTIYFILAQTGCSCCSDQDYIDGPYLSHEKAQEHAESMKGYKALASQYAERGIYTILSAEGEDPLPDGRIICGARIFDPDRYYDSFPTSLEYELEGAKRLNTIR